MKMEHLKEHFYLIHRKLFVVKIMFCIAPKFTDGERQLASVVNFLSLRGEFENELFWDE